jgi:hypothetical protein
VFDLFCIFVSCLDLVLSLLDLFLLPWFVLHVLQEEE